MSSPTAVDASHLRSAAARAALILAISITAILFSAPSGAAQDFKAIHSFGAGTDGANPVSGLVRDSVGNLYGTTAQGGDYGLGTVFEYSISGTETVLYSFMGGTDGANPFGGLVRDSAGNLYGTTEYGGDLSCGSYGCGTLFEINTSGTESVLHAFSGGSDGTFPTGGLFLDSSGNLYGTTSQGGSGIEGTVFELASNLSYSLLTNFTRGVDGRNPAAGLVEDKSGNLYGTTQTGGIFDEGTVFEVPAGGGSHTTLYSFTGGGDGAMPGDGSLIMDSSGNLYGTTIGGGECRYGAAFELDSSRKESVLWSFGCEVGYGSDGASPYSALLEDAFGDLIGTDFRGGSYGFGAVFKVIPSNGSYTEKVLHTFTGGADGGSPVAGLATVGAGNMYGTTSIGGANDAGVIFQLFDLALGLHFDFDDDAGTDYTVWRPSNGTWYVLATDQEHSLQRQLGASGDIVTPGDYDGDGITDYAVFQPSTAQWSIILSSTGQTESETWGTQGDIPVPGDYTGEGLTDLAVWRPSDGTWYVSTEPARAPYPWGTNGDIPVPGDYDGDYKTDYAVWRPSNGTWYVVYSSTGEVVTKAWGMTGDIPVPGDYDGDGKTDYAVWRPSSGTWYIIYSSTGQLVQYSWGMSGDIPVPRDYDGDNKTDYAVWRPSNGTWYVIDSSTGQPATAVWGMSTDVPVNMPTGAQQ